MPWRKGKGATGVHGEHVAYSGWGLGLKTFYVLLFSTKKWTRARVWWSWSPWEHEVRPLHDLTYYSKIYYIIYLFIFVCFWLCKDYSLWPCCSGLVRSNSDTLPETFSLVGFLAMLQWSSTLEFGYASRDFQFGGFW